MIIPSGVGLRGLFSFLNLLKEFNKEERMTDKLKDVKDLRIFSKERYPEGRLFQKQIENEL